MGLAGNRDTFHLPCDPWCPPTGRWAVSLYGERTRQPKEGHEYADATLLVGTLDMLAEQAREIGPVPLTKDGEVVAMVVTPEVARARVEALKAQDG